MSAKCEIKVELESGEGGGYFGGYMEDVCQMEIKVEL